MKAIITVELDYPEQIYDLYETKELRLYDDKGEFFIWEGGFEIKPMPQKNKYDVEKYATVDYENNVTLGHFLNKGYNKCIDEITGETE